MLNGNRIYFKSVLDQGFWPESVLTPPTDEAIQYDIRITKEMGFNGARRLVIDNEGWEHTAMTDLCAVHNYARIGDLLYEAYKDMGGKPGERVERNSVFECPRLLTKPLIGAANVREGSSYGAHFLAVGALGIPRLWLPERRHRLDPRRPAGRQVAGREARGG